MLPSAYQAEKRRKLMASAREQFYAAKKQNYTVAKIFAHLYKRVLSPGILVILTGYFYSTLFQSIAMPSQLQYPLRRSIVFFICIPFCITLICSFAGPSSGWRTRLRFLKTEDGVIIYPDYRLSGNTKAVRLRVIADNIIRVTADPDPQPDLPGNESLIIVAPSPAGATWDVAETKDGIVLRTSLLIATADPMTGAVAFTDLNGKAILSEREGNGRA